ncbi:hypothetical protein [Halolamina sediminis]|jgi:hypothetical protein|uniref:hypothetical protein n=1 Tax=Halolamina sediminis TaxID=1480675 RepID=UPI0006B56A6F|nr:hypothetical protein [Halolamina sediminis]
MVPGIVPDMLLVLAILWLFDSVALSPVLVSSAVRRLFRDRPTEYLFLNYLAGTAAYAVSHLLVVMVPIFVLKGGRLHTNTFAWLGGLTLLNLVLWWLGLSIVAPISGYWAPKTGDEYDGRIALTLGLVSYVVATAALGFLALVAIIAIGFPG